VALMAIKGSLSEASLPDVIQLLALGRRSGCLAVADRQNFGYIYFQDGRIIFASIVNRRDRLGDLLVRNGKLSAELLQQAVDLQAGNPERRIGQLLLDLGAITPEALREFVALQIEEAVYFLFTWTSGSFNFEAGVEPESQDLLVSINPESLLLEGARRVDEWSLIAKKLPSFDLIFSVDPSHVAGSDVKLSSEQVRILPLLDGTRDVQQVMEESGMVEFEVGKAIYGLLVAGFAHRTGASQASAAPRASDARVEEHRNLGVAFFRTGMLDEAQREFRRVADLRPTEAAAPFYLGLLALKQARWTDAVAAFRDCIEKGGPRPAALHDLGVALECLGRLDDAEAAFGEAAGRARDDARILLGWGILALKRGDTGAAESRLARARERMADGAVPAIWFWAHSLAAAAADRPDIALKSAQDGVAAHPSSAILRNNLAVLLETGGDAAGAEHLLRAALAEEPTIPQISKNLGDLCYRSGRYDEAASMYDRAAKLDPDLGDDLYFKLGNIAFKRRDAGQARTCWERATALNPAHQLARANLDMLDSASR
jgi:tetratricopeptide (TPR) repeat protein